MCVYMCVCMCVCVCMYVCVVFVYVYVCILLPNSGVVHFNVDCHSIATTNYYSNIYEGLHIRISMHMHLYICMRMYMKNNSTIE